MSGSVQGPGSQSLIPTTTGTESGAALSKGVGKGAVGDAALNMLQGDKAITQSQIQHRPALAQPKPPTKTSQAEAKTELTELNTISEEAEAEVANLLKALKEGKLSPEQKQQLKTWGVDLEETGKYLEMLKGKHLEDPKNQRFLLAAMGQKQTADVMSLRDPDKLQQALTDKYGKAGLAEQVKDLKALGYNESQIKSMLTMASPHKVDAQLLSKYPKGSKEHKLASLGFDKNQIAELMALLKGGKAPKDSMVNNQFMRDLLGKAGFSKTEIDMLLATGDKNAMNKMIQHGKDFSKDQIDQFLVAGHLFRTMASKTNPVMPVHLDQLSMIFEVLTLLHKMGARERQTSRLTRQIAYDGAKKAIEDQADEIRKAATQTMIAEVVMGSLSIAGGLASFGGALKSGSPKTGTGKSGAQSGTSGVAGVVDDAAGAMDDVDMSTQKNSTKQKSKGSRGSTGNIDGQNQQTVSGSKTKGSTNKQAKDLEAQMNETSSQKADVKAEQQTIQNRQKTDLKRDQVKTDMKRTQQNTQVDGAGTPTNQMTGIRDGAAGRAGQVRQNTQVNNGKMNPNHPRYDKSPGHSSVTGKRIPSQRQLDVQEFRSGNYNRNGKQMNWKEFQETKYGKGNFEKQAQSKTEQQTGVGRSNSQLDSKDSARQTTKTTNNQQTQAKKQQVEIEQQQAKTKTSNQQAENNQQMSLQDRKKAELKRVNDRLGGKTDSEGGSSGKIDGTSTPTVGSKTNASKGGGQGNSGQGKSAKSDFEQINAKQESAKSAKSDQKTADARTDKTKKDIKANDAAQKADMDLAQAEYAQMQRKTAIFQGFGQVLSGIGQVTGGIIKYQAAEHNAREKELMAVQKAYENAATSSGEMMQNHHELVKNALGKFEEIERTTADTLRNLARG